MGPKPLKSTIYSLGDFRSAPTVLSVTVDRFMSPTFVRSQSAILRCIELLVTENREDILKKSMKRYLGNLWRGLKGASVESLNHSLIPE